MLKYLLLWISMISAISATDCFGNIQYVNIGERSYAYLRIYVEPKTPQIELEVTIGVPNNHTENVELRPLHNAKQMLETLTYGGYVPFSINVDGTILEIKEDIRLNGKQLCEINSDIDSIAETKHFKYERKFISLSRDKLRRIGGRKRKTRAIKCGIRSSIPNPLVLGGKQTTIEDWPWLAALMMKKRRGYEYFCAGSVIKKTMIITAAHCVKLKNDATRDVNTFIAVLGSVNPGEVDDETGKMVHIKKIYPHPNYNRQTLRNDIAILHIDRLSYNDAIIPICLWGEDVDQSKLHKKVGTVVGWGLTEEERTSDYPKEADVRIIGSTTCKAEEVKLFDTVWRNNFCAKGIDGTPCNGDSGSGLYMKVDNSWTIRGIISVRAKSDKTCPKHGIVVFTDVAQYAEWIYTINRKI